MIQERYCSYELSKLLKDKGFDEPCHHCYDYEEDDGKLLFSFKERVNSDLYDLCTVPTHQMACDWLREKGYHIEIYANASGYNYIISKTPNNGTDIHGSHEDYEGTNDGGAWDDYGECVEAAIKYCLTNLI